jgi:hypothetical protein
MLIQKKFNFNNVYFYTKLKVKFKWFKKLTYNTVDLIKFKWS